MAKKKQVSRRGFLGAASGTAAAGLSGCAPAGDSGSTQTAPAGGVWERPPDQRDKGNRRNLIFLSTDTFRADNLACYGGNGLVRCPRLDAFSEDCVIFDDCYPEAMPTIPIRRVIMTGRRIIPYYSFHQHEPVQLPGWHELYYEDQTISETLTEAGYHTALIADIPHLQRPGKNFHRGYGYYEWSRGHEVDFYEQAPHELQTIVPDHYPQEYWDRWLELDPGRPDFMRQFLANRERYEAAGAEALIEITAKNVIAWLERNHDKQPFYLHLEAFDPHEPWDPPQRFLDEYLPNASGPTWWEPPYSDIEVPPEGVERMRANYAGEAMCVDYWLGEILDKIEELGLYDNSVVAFFSDHGALLGEQGEFLKGPERIRRQVTHNPLLVRVPGKEQSGRAGGFIQHPDVMPTLMNLLELDPPPRATGKNLWGMTDGSASGHEHVVQCYGWIGAVRTPEWQFSTVIDQERYGREYPPQLYNRADDPDELTNVAADHPAVVEELTAKINDYIGSGREITQGSFHAKMDVRPG